ncbi:MmpS family transport accessory protein [Streptomyces jumonjinensis]|uniref:MmpS family transport accessory protein n=1 Tax=Streptomyces jumonjinensis TaxID=1945 RepID=UPI0037AA6BE7
MHRSIRTAVCAVAAVGLVFGLSACSEVSDAAKDKASDSVDKAVNEEYEVTYEVTGKSIDSIQFAAGGGTATNPKLETVDKPALPWKKTVTLRGILPPSVLPIALDATGEAAVTCKIIYKGKPIAEESGKGLGAAGGCVAVSPIV